MAISEKAKTAAGKSSRQGGARQPKTGPEPRPVPTPEAPEASSEKLRGRADQLGAILTKGLDLAEAGLSLGLTVIRRVGSVAQDSVFDGFTGVPQAPPPVAPDTAAGFAPQRPAAEPAAPDLQAFSITNRLPVGPGGSVNVSFSINNDSPAAPKRVSLRVESFTGEARGGRLSGDLFSIKPAEQTIAPMDFEKFVLMGEIPPNAPPDVYHGSIVVSSEDDFTIPIRLIVSS